ncbi:MAG: DNA polymerase III subunit chi [Rhodobiaceae bacterium]|nr:DNA polymerase III subunit chi [Rhodobiaceae bacterium]
MTEVLFYHLQQTPLEQVLPSLLERSLDRGWKAVVQVGNPERLDALNGVLWTYSDDAFLPHGTKEDGPLEKQPVALTGESENPNGAEVLFLVDGAAPGEIEPYERCVLMFDGRDEDAVGAARGHWKALSEGGHDVTYWQQNDAGGWEKKA